VPETFEQRRLGAVLRACRALRHEFATPLSAAVLHLELARRAADRADGAIPAKVRTGLETGMQQVDEASRLLEGLTALGSAHEGRPAVLDFFTLLADAAGRAGAELGRRGLNVHTKGPAAGALVEGFPDELVGATEEALLTASRWAEPGDAGLETRLEGGIASFAFRVSLAAGGPPGDMLFKTRSRPNAGLGPFISRWVFEAHGGRLEGHGDGGHLTVTGSLPHVAAP
jgi:signal transduction histidine kinase